MFEKQYEKYKIITKDELNFDLQENAKLSPHYSANPEGDWVGLSAVLKILFENIEERDEYQLLEVGCAHRTFCEIVL